MKNKILLVLLFFILFLFGALVEFRLFENMGGAGHWLAGIAGYVLGISAGVIVLILMDR